MTDLVQLCRTPKRLAKRRAVVEATRKLKPFLHLLNGSVRVTHRCLDESANGVAANAGIMTPILQGLPAMLVASIKSQSNGDVLACFG